MLEIEALGSLILVLFVLHREGSNLHHLSRRSAVLAAAGQKTQDYNALGFLSAMISLLTLCSVESEQTQCMELLLEMRDFGGSYLPMMASTVCDEPK